MNARAAAVNDAAALDARPSGPAPGRTQWVDAVLAAALLAVDPEGIGGAVIGAFPGPARARWLENLRGLLTPGYPWQRLLPHMDERALLGGLDLPSSLARGAPVVQPGLLARADRGILEVAMAERLAALQVAALCNALETGRVVLERDGCSRTWPARIALVALDEHDGTETPCAAALADRCAFLLDLHAVSVRDLDELDWRASDIVRARAALPDVDHTHALTESLCRAAVALGIESLRAPILALRTARAAAALVGASTVGDDQARLAVRLVYGPRARRSAPPPGDAPDAARDRDAVPPGGADTEPGAFDAQTALLVEAVAGTRPSDVFTTDRRRHRLRGSGPAGRVGPERGSVVRGRPIGARHAVPEGGARLDLLATLKAALPWQSARAQLAHAQPGRLAIRRDDLHVRRFRQRAATATIFAVDASGSAAMQRLGEAKGAVELLLADCYVRRDSVALIAFRGHTAELLLPPTRSLVRAKRLLQSLAGGGGTPLATGLQAALELAGRLLRAGTVPLVVTLTDGRANVTRAGHGGRREAEAEAIAAAQQLRAAGVPVVLVDTSPRGERFARTLAAAAAGRYLALPHADARALSKGVRALAMGSDPHGR